MKKLIHNLRFPLIAAFLLFLNDNAYLFAIESQSTMEGIFKENIKSVSLYREGWKLSYPIAELNGGTKLLLSFDELNDKVVSYSYRIIHCDFDWNPSPISEQDYIEGFRQNQINDYSFSFNTYIRYVHYSLKLPNPDVRFLISGNYIIEVFEEFDEREVIFRKRFIITEPLVNVVAKIQRPILSSLRDIGQEVNFTIEYKSFSIDNPFKDVRVAILQNGRWDNAVTDLLPLFDKWGVLEYNYQKENVFPGGNEYRWFDIKSTRYQSPYIKEIRFSENCFNVYLFPEEIRSGKPYFYNQDINGKYYVEVQEGVNNDLDADYVRVNFTLPYEYQRTDGDFYVMGALTNNTFSPFNRMNYNSTGRSYELTLTLKQGYYNYRYEFLKKGTYPADHSLTEGNHYETENDYIIIVYYHGSRSRYDRIIGYQIANSLKRN